MTTGNMASRKRADPSSNVEMFEAKSLEPLAARMRPRTLDEVVGQQHLLGPGKPLRESIERGTVSSMGLTKPLVFGGLISITACYFGLNTTGGTEGVGISTTRTVVVSSILILIVDYFITQILLSVLSYA